MNYIFAECVKRFEDVDGVNVNQTHNTDLFYTTKVNIANVE